MIHLLGAKRKAKVWFIYPEILKTMTFKLTLCPKVFQSFAKITFFTIFLKKLKDLTFQFCRVGRQHSNFIFAFCFHGGVWGLEKHIQMRNMK